MKISYKIFARLMLLTGALLLAACSDDDSDDLLGTQIRVLHASPDAPAVNVWLNGTIAVPNLDFAESSGVVTTLAGSKAVAVEGIIPGGNAIVIPAEGDSVELSFTPGSRHDIVAVGPVSNIEPVILETPIAFSTSQARVLVLHAAHEAPQVDVHVTGPFDELSSATVLGSFSFKESLGPVLVPGGEYRIRVTAAGSLDPLFDSGAITISNGDDLFLAAVKNTQMTNSGAAKSPISLALLADEDAMLYNQNDGADILVAHNSADAPAVDVIANNLFESPLVEDLAFPDSAGYGNVAAGNYNVKVTAANDTNPVIEAPLSFANGDVASVIALGSLASIEPLVLMDNPRMVATEARVRVVHGSVFADTATPDGVDVYVTSGADISAATPVLEGVMFKDYSDYLSLAAGDYYVSLTITGTQTIAFQAMLSFEAGSVSTVLARDSNDSFDGVAASVF